MASTANRAVDTRLVSEWEYPLAANVNVLQGDMVILVSGQVVPANGAFASGAVVGVARENVNNLGGVAGAKSVTIKFLRPRHCTQFPLAASGAPTSANVGGLVYCDAQSNVILAATGNQIGLLVAIITNAGALVEVGAA